MTATDAIAELEHRWPLYAAAERPRCWLGRADHRRGRPGAPRSSSPWPMALALVASTPAVRVAETLGPSTVTTAALVATGRCAQWEQTALDAGWPLEQWPTIDRAMWCESKRQPGAHNRAWARPADATYGLLQARPRPVRPAVNLPMAPRCTLPRAGAPGSADDRADLINVSCAKKRRRSAGERLDLGAKSRPRRVRAALPSPGGLHGRRASSSPAATPKAATAP